MEGLDEGLHRQLPVARHDLGDVDRLVAVLQGEGLEMRGQDFEVAFQPLAIGVEIDEDETAPHADLGFGQAPFRPVDLREIPRRRQFVQLALQAPGKAMERAAELVHAAALRAQRGAAMEAGVHIGADFGGAGADHDQRIVDDLVEHMVADVGDLLDATSQLPGLAPDLIDLAVVPGLGEVAFDRDVLEPEIGGRGFLAHDGGREDRVARQDFLHRRAGTLQDDVEAHGVSLGGPL